ncbi:ATP-binding cassette domain-containing protein [Cohnella thailandensis]|uniref:ABC transporter ATP-binding protein n=1 Tax=Cohnella thailandensis TaxID=557557 RepID=A0A841SXH3_9BACL|nr:ABC transporter ATP-binding protein [Cohnella thailandensis]MBP1974999.1 simple sugar transport system ATP-binding protein [Cohnella thailandensis]
MGQAVPVVELKGITKRFPGIVANDSISLQLRKGEIHALLGENGAGKSTLMSILFGLYQPDEGEIYINGAKETIDGPGKAIKLGIGMVHQHFKLVQNFTVAENIVLGIEPKKGLSINYRNANDRVQQLSEQYGLKVDPKVKIEDITVGMQQRVEILKTLYRGAEILIFDEPTAVLTVQEIQELMQILRSLAAEGKSIILITHKLKEIMEVSDRVTVIRRGKVIDTLVTAETNENELAEKMVGRRVSFELAMERKEPGSPLVKIDNLTVQGADKGKNILENISMVIRSGEIYGLAGVDGNGQRELVEAITGIRPIHSGSVMLGNADLTQVGIRERMVSGIAQIPEDRQKHGLVLDFKVSENMVLTTYKDSRFGKNGFLNDKEIERHASRLTSEFDVRSAGIQVSMRSLSGGNQQKAIIARELTRDPQLLIAVQPTRGLDIGAIEFVHERLMQAKNEGKAILLISYELDELYKMSDRIAVINEGRIMGVLDREEVNDEKLGLMMAGNKLGAKDGGAA